MPLPNALPVVLPFPTRREIATIAMARVIIADLTHALRVVCPEHPVLQSLEVFLPGEADGQ